MNQQTQEDQGDGQFGADVGDGNNGGPQLDGPIAHGVLDGVARLMGRHADGGGGRVVVDRIRQADDVGPGGS